MTTPIPTSDRDVPDPSDSSEPSSPSRSSLPPLSSLLPTSGLPPEPKSFTDKLVWFCLHNRLVVILLLVLLVVGGLVVSPFDTGLSFLPRDPVSVDALPDLGENQQIVFSDWSGRSPQDIENQITYPLTTALMGIAGIKTVRSFSAFGFSSVYLIFEEKADFYASRSRILEKLNSLPRDLLPAGVTPRLGPDATGLGQIFWYTLEGRDPKGKPAAGWDSFEIRKLQDFTIRYALQSVPGVAEVASIGGFVPEMQVEADPAKLRAYGVSLQTLVAAIRASNQEIGARTIEINRVEYIIRAKGYLRSLEELQTTVLQARQGTPLLLRDVARLTWGPGSRRGVLDKDGAEVVGGVVVARYGSNPMQILQDLKKKIAEIAPGLPRRTLADGRSSQITIVPFYDRTHLIRETLATLEEAISLEILITILVVLFMMGHLRSALLIAGGLPLAVLLCFLLMRWFQIEANVVALCGIAIAIGTMVDMGIILSDTILQELQDAPPDEAPLHTVYRATASVASAVLTAISTTVVSFLPVIAMEGAEGKLFRPLAITKTFALLASLVVALTILPAFATWFFSKPSSPSPAKRLFERLGGWLSLLLLLAGVIGLGFHRLGGFVLLGLSAYRVFQGAVSLLPDRWLQRLSWLSNALVILLVTVALAVLWLPFGPSRSLVANVLFVAFFVGGLLVFFAFFRIFYSRLLRFFLRHKLLFLSLPAALIVLGLWIWLGFARVFGFVPEASSLRTTSLWTTLSTTFPGLPREFMPDLDEGSFLFMPTTMPHASIGESIRILQELDKRIQSIPEVQMAVGKIGRVESPMDPAPLSMVETVIQYKPEYQKAPDGRRLRLWRPHIRSPRDIWKEILEVTTLPGVTSAPYLQPIAARIVMLQSGLRSSMGLKIKGPDLASIETTALAIEALLKKVEGINPATVLADRVEGKPYLEFQIDRKESARYGLRLTDIQDAIQMAIGGMPITTTIQGRERYPIVLRYPRELRTDLTALRSVLVQTPSGSPIPLAQVASLQYTRGPQMIKSEDSFLLSYVIFDKAGKETEIEIIKRAQDALQNALQTGSFKLPPGVSYAFAGTYENQRRAERRLALILPITLFLIFLILYFQFSSTSTTIFVFSGVLVAWAGGFLFLWATHQPWFLQIHLFGIDLRAVFPIPAVAMSIAVWVGFLALFGVATDDGVVIATYLDQAFQAKDPQTLEAIHHTVVEAGERRIRACLMTTATTILALLPILTSTGRGSDIMIPMALPSFGGMIIELFTLFVVPILYSWREEWKRLSPPPVGKGRGEVSDLRSHGRGVGWASLAIAACLGSFPAVTWAGGPASSPASAGAAVSSASSASPLPALPLYSDPPESLAALIQEALQKNPSLQTLRQRIVVSRAKEKQAGAWPDLEVGLHAMNFPIPTFDPTSTMMTGIQYEVMQRFPNLGRLRMQRAIVGLETAMLQTFVEEKALEVAYEVKEAVYRVAWLHQAWEKLRSIDSLTEMAAKIALSRYAITATPLQEILQARILQAQIRSQALQWIALERSSRLALARLLGRSATKPLGKMPTFPSLTKAASPLAAMSPEALLQEALQKRPSFRRLEIAAKQARRQADLGRSMFWPDVRLRVSVMQNFPNGMNPHALPFLSVGVQIPIPSWGNPARSAAIEESQARHHLVATETRDLHLQIALLIGQIHASLLQVQGQISLAQDQILPLLDQAHQSALSQFRVGRLGFAVVLASLRALFQERLQADQLLLQQALLSARLHALVGATSLP